MWSLQMSMPMHALRASLLTKRQLACTCLSLYNATCRRIIHRIQGMQKSTHTFLRSGILARSPICSNNWRHLSATAIVTSGHNKWSTIKHDKAKKDSSKGKERAALANELCNASKYGGTDPAFNPRLTTALAAAKKFGFPKASIEAAIARGQGKSASGAALENITIEAVVPPVAVIVDCQTESKARALMDIRFIFRNHGASVTPTAYLFEKRGRVKFRSKEGVDIDGILETALENGAIDVIEDEDEVLVVDTEASMLKAAEKSLSDAFNLEIESSETIWHPNEDTMVTSTDEESLDQLSKMLEELQGYPGVQAVYTNLASNELAKE